MSTKQKAAAKKAAIAKAIVAKSNRYVPRLPKQMSLAKPKPMYGRGGYGQKIGSYLGSMAGGALGNLAEQGIKSLFGFGDYEVKRNVIWDQMKGQDPPKMENPIKGKSDCVIRHREYIGDIISSSSANTFNLQSFNLNPGLPASFPWLATIAQQYEQYEFEGIVYEFKSMAADALNSTNIALGTVIMGTEYNSALPNFINKQQMENHEFSSSCKPACSSFHPIECARSETALPISYVRTGAVPANADIRMYDLGNFQIATTGFQGTSVNCGELWCTYQIRFKKPISNAALGNNLLTDHFQLSGTIATATPLGTTSTAVAGSNLGVVLFNNHSVQFPNWIQNGTYKIDWVVVGISGAVAFSGPAGTSNLTQLSVYNNDAANSASNTGTTSAVFLWSTVVKITGPSAYLDLGTSTFTGVPASAKGDLFVTQINANIAT